MKKSVYINFVGAPSSGKSLMSALTYAELKSRHRNVEMVQEYAKMLVYMENFEMLNCQWMVSYEQAKMLKALQGKVQYICTDCPLVIGLYYNRYYPDNVCDVQKTEQMIVSKMKELEPSVYVFLERNESFPYETEGRVHNEEEARLIDTQLKALLDELQVRYISIKSDKANVPGLVDHILTST